MVASRVLWLCTHTPIECATGLSRSLLQHVSALVTNTVRCQALPKEPSGQKVVYMGVSAHVVYSMSFPMERRGWQGTCVVHRCLFRNGNKPEAQTAPEAHTMFLT